MLPLRDESLSLSKIATHWSRGSDGSFTETEAMDVLLAAFWGDELQVAMPDGDALGRIDMLHRLLNRTDQPGFIIADKLETRHPNEATLGDDEIWCGWQLYLSLPDDAKKAFEKLAHSSIDSYSDAVKVILYSMTVTKFEFLDWCNRSSYPVPAFWSGGTAAQTAKAHSEAQLEKWLKNRFAQLSVTPRKADVSAEAKLIFSGLSGRAFNRAWAKTRPKQGRSGGRPPMRSTR